LVGVFSGTANAAVVVPDITAFPVVGNVTYIDDFGAPRPQGPHEGNDIMSVRHQPAIAFETGHVEKWSSPGRTGTCMVYLHGRSGMTYVYIHLNNDLGPTNDNDGGCRNGVSYAPGLRNGDRVVRGQLVGFVGDSGDANGMQPHLHFEVRKPSGRAIDPYTYLNRAKHVLFPRPRPDQGDVTLTLRAATVVSTTDTTITVRTKRIAVDPLGLSYIYVRRVTLDTSTATVERKSSSGALTTTDVSTATVGERVRAHTPAFTPTWSSQRAGPSVLSASQLILFTG
jgi:hypothetical protein